MMDSRTRILEATYSCAGRWGLAKTSLEDVAREAGVSRATIYRTFPGGRDEVVEATVAWAVARFYLGLLEHLVGVSSLEDVLVRGMMFAHREIVEHEVLQRIMLTEPDLLLPMLTLESNRLRESIATFLLSYVAGTDLVDGVDPELASDFLARMVVSYIATPGRWDLTDSDEVSDLVRAELLAGLVR